MELSTETNRYLEMPDTVTKTTTSAAQIPLNQIASVVLMVDGIDLVHTRSGERILAEIPVVNGALALGTTAPVQFRNIGRALVQAYVRKHDGSLELASPESNLRVHIKIL